MSVLTRLFAATQDERSVRKVALAYLLAVTLAELLTTFYEPRLGLLLHGLLVLILVTHTALTWERPAYQFLLALTFAPLIRLLSLSLPMGRFPQVYWYLITSIPLFATVWMAMQRLNLDWDSVGLNLRAWALQIPIALTGLLFGYLEYRILQPRPLAAAFTWQQIWLPALILLVSTGFAEEIIFRGLMQRTTEDSLGRWSNAYVSMLFAVLHIGYRSLLDVVFVFVVAMFFGEIVRRTRSIIGVTFAHGLTNIVLFLVAPFLF
ncbi:MAG: CPBP family intramembrane metalloprotease [Chloroflexi bacterium]|nr:CPBP family intramembrane metalloprotease [Chloroflexota bacterium]